VILVISGVIVEINKKDVKSMRLYVKPPNGDVHVSAPHSMPNEDIEKFVWIKVNWIKEQIEKIKNLYYSPEREYISGETINVWGKQYNLQLKFGKKYSLILCNDTAILTARKISTVDQRKKFVHKWYRELLVTEINRLLPKWEKKTNLKASSWHIKYMTTRWGTCKPKQGKVWFNLQLAAKPIECLEYIILHELMHFIERGHNKKFYSLLEKYMPTWKQVRALLK